MIEDGLAQLIGSDPAVAAIAATGGYLATLPKDHPLPSWTHQTISEEPLYTLLSLVQLRKRRMQFDCYAEDPDQCIALAYAVDAVLSFYHGVLTDPEATLVQGIFQSNTMDFFDDPSRSYRRSLEYEVWFNQGN